eukprot:m.143141 g.143141  ORF g.143141 m.143141 type:complete len:356 (-) comp9660_c1_seq1:58-1125(-)
MNHIAVRHSRLHSVGTMSSLHLWLLLACLLSVAFAHSEPEQMRLESTRAAPALTTSTTASSVATNSVLARSTSASATSRSSTITEKRDEAGGAAADWTTTVKSISTSVESYLLNTVVGIFVVKYALRLPGASKRIGHIVLGLLCCYLFRALNQHSCYSPSDTVGSVEIGPVYHSYTVGSVTIGPVHLLFIVVLVVFLSVGNSFVVSIVYILMVAFFTFHPFVMRVFYQSAARKEETLFAAFMYLWCSCPMYVSLARRIGDSISNWFLQPVSRVSFLSGLLKPYALSWYFNNVKGAGNYVRYQHDNRLCRGILVAASSSSCLITPIDGNIVQAINPLYVFLFHDDFPDPPLVNDNE